MTRRTRVIVLGVIAGVAVLLLTPFLLKQSDDAVRLELRAAWWGFEGASRALDTLVVVARSGADLDRGWRFDGWSGADDGRPFVLGSNAGHDRVWVRFPRDVASGMAMGVASAAAYRDSIVVSTAWRSFYAEAGRGRMRFQMRVLPQELLRPPAEDAPLSVVGMRSMRRPFERAMLNAEVAGVFRLDRGARGRRGPRVRRGGNRGR